MTMTNESADDNALADMFSTDREDRGGKEPVQSEPAPVETTGSNRDERGRFAAKSEPIAEVKPDPLATPPPQEAANVPGDVEPPVTDPNTNRHVPLSELLSARKKGQESERLRIEAEARAQAYEKMLQQQSVQSRAAPPQAQQQAVPDPYADPEGYVQFHIQQLEHKQRITTLNLYEERVRDKHGDQVVNEAMQAAEQAGIVDRLRNQENPWASLIRWHVDHKQRTEIGGDLDAFKKRIADEAVAQALANLKAGNTTAGTPQPQQFPGSLAAATATGKQGAHLTDEAAMTSIFASDRKRK